MNSNPRADGSRPGLPYALFAALGTMTILVVAAASFVYLGHSAPPAAPVVVAVTPASALPAPSAANTAQPSKQNSGTAPISPPAAAIQAPTPAAPAAMPLTPIAKATVSTPSAGARALPPAPDPALIARGTYGFVPIIGKEDRRPWNVYARPFDLTDKRPRIAIIVTGLGISASATDSVIRDAPGPLTLAFAPFARRLGQWMNLARANGHETLIELPMEPIDYPRQDPGFNALLTALTPPQNIDRLGWVMAQGAGYVGVMGLLGGRFSAADDAMKPILQEIEKRGLLYIDNRASPQSVVPHVAPSIDLPFASVNRYIDSDPSPTEIERSLADLEEAAKRYGSALGEATASKATLGRITAWASGLEGRGLVLVPVSAIVTAPTGADKSATP